MLSNAFLLNRNHDSFIKTGKGKVDINPVNVLWVAVGLVIFIFGLFRVDLTQNAILDWQVLEERGITESYRVQSTSESNQVLDTRTEVRFGESGDTRSFTATRYTYNYEPFFENGQPYVNVVVDPESPMRMQLESAMTFPLYVFGLTALFIVGGVVMVLWGARQLYYTWRLSRNGELIPGHIRYVTQLRRNNQLVYKVDYTFPNPHGDDMLTGRSTHIRRTLENRPLPEKGMPVAVLYLDDDHHQAL